MTPRRLLLLLVLLAACSSLHAACPCVSVFCPCCIDRCRLGFIKVSQDGCRDRGGLESYTVVMRIGRDRTEVMGYQMGRLPYEAAKSVWEAGGTENAPALSDAARSLLGYEDATLASIADGTWAAKHTTEEMAARIGAGKPLLIFAPLGFTGSPFDSPGAVTGAALVLDLSTGQLRGDADGTLSPIGEVKLANEPSSSVRAAWLNAINGRRLTDADPQHADFGLVAANPDFYSWRSCTDSDTCSLLFVIAAALILVTAPYLKAFVPLLVAGAAGISILAQSLGWYCGVYPCNRTCTFGTIAMETRYWVRLDASEPTTGTDDPTDVIINSMALTARVDMVPQATGGYGFSSKHFRGETHRIDGTPIEMLFKGTIVDLGASSLDMPTPENPAGQFRLMLVPPSKPSELLPGGSFGIEKRN